MREHPDSAPMEGAGLESRRGRRHRRRLLELLGERGCVELLAVLELDERERAALIGRLYASERGRVLAELLVNVEVDDLVRLRLITALREVLG